MQIIIPSDCGNSPRMAIVSEFVTNWMSGSYNISQELLAEDATWELIGKHTLTGPEEITLGGVCEGDHLEMLTVINHGRTAACAGFLVADGIRKDFCHVISFKSPTKTAKIASIRTFCITSP